MLSRRATVLCSVLVGLASPALGQSKKKPPAAQPGSKATACASVAHHQFDFWLGAWDVATPQGTPAGTNHVERLLDGCALQEQWEATDGSKGTSLSSYDAVARKWRQTFVDDTGQVLVLEGEFKDGKMVLQGEKTMGKQRSAQQRISWQVVGDKVRQRWDISQDDGKNWSVLFEGVYSRKKP
ncbi:MAG: hypothetical protein ACLQDQ_17705 [Myxococcaceae bacterium]